VTARSKGIGKDITGEPVEEGANAPIYSSSRGRNCSARWKGRRFLGWLEALLAAVAGLLGGFISTLASNGSGVTLPALESLGLPEHVANGTNRLSVVALGLVGTVGFYRQGLVDWRKGSWIAALVGLGTIVGSFVAVELGEAVLDSVIIAGLLIVLGLLLVEPGR
jgi:uncharacterized protein